MGQSRPLQGYSILVVEDDPLQALDIAESLGEAGAAIVGPVYDLHEAVRVVRTESADAAVLDFRFGMQNSTDLAQELYRQRTPFVIHTGYHEVPTIVSQWRGCRLIAKPSNIARLIKTLEALMRWKRLRLRRDLSLENETRV